MALPGKLFTWLTMVFLLMWLLNYLTILEQHGASFSWKMNQVKNLALLLKDWKKQMAKTFSSLDKFSKHIEKVLKSYDQDQNKALDVVGKDYEKKAKQKIGHLQQSDGPFKAWDQLAESTKEDKERQGYVFNTDYNPLFRTGALRESISYVVNKIEKTVYLGSDNEIMIYQELGTIFIPPRSVLGLTVFKEKKYTQEILGKMLTDWISGNKMNFTNKAD